MRLVGSRHSDTPTLRHCPTLRHSDTPTLRHCSTPVKEVHCQESPTLADTAPTLPRHYSTPRHQCQPTLPRHCPDTAPTLARHWPDTGPTLLDTPTLRHCRAQVRAEHGGGSSGTWRSHEAWVERSDQRNVFRSLSTGDASPGGHMARNVLEAIEAHQSAVTRPPQLSRSATQDGLTCPICIDVLAAPVTLECGHTCCKSCFVLYLEKDQTKTVCPSAQCKIRGARCQRQTGFVCAVRRGASEADYGHLRG